MTQFVSSGTPYDEKTTPSFSSRLAIDFIKTTCMKYVKYIKICFEMKEILDFNIL